MIAAPTFSQIKAQVAAVLSQSKESCQTIGIHAQGRWSGERHQVDGDQEYLIDQCDSPLAIRLALQADIAQAAIHVIVTALDESDLAEDILIRLAKRRLFKIDPWQIIKSLFRATNIDPRLMEHRWMPGILMDWMPANRYSPAMGGFLDAEVVWPLLLGHSIQLTANYPDLVAILHWSTDADHTEHYQTLSDEIKTAVGDWLTNLAGPTVKPILKCVDHAQQPDALPLGLVAAVVYHPEANLDKAIGKLEERFLAGDSPEPAMMQSWSKAAKQTLKQLPDRQQYALIHRSDTILAEIGAKELAYLSPFSEQGFNQILTTLSRHLITHVQQPTQATLDNLLETYRIVQQHHQANKPNRRLQRLDMAMRLAQWLVTDTSTKAKSPPKSLEDAIAHHTTTGSFLDWARLMLPVADPHRDLAKAYGKLFETVTHCREKQAQEFANLLQNWTAVGSTRKSILPVEDILDTVVAPLATNHPVLVIVMDGMSMAVSNELLSHITQQQAWQLVCPKEQSSPLQPGLAAIPSETSVSRASLLCGQLTKGLKPEEKKGFRQHPALVKFAKRNPPVLFHKDSLLSDDPPDISNDLYETLSNKKHQVVGLVINAVDDLLSKADQVDIVWSCDRIKILQTILQAANSANRLIVLTSDHGHVLHYNNSYQDIPKGAKGGERWRVDQGKPKDNELKMTGARVIAPEGQSIIAPWTENIRYSKSKKYGYHGGINPQEMVVPIAILAPSGHIPKNWKQTELPTPPWWELQLPKPPEIAPEAIDTPTPDPPATTQSDFGPLFSYAGTTPRD
ncbi:BREX-2 system phosphatase PglZ [Leptothoe sp. PORK10 BA2]|uniref:BREX-2 system phosphatase PglZ n=1 Tax=Leptothoe sp. PORK10 BA2 TaxID=3110254 RepID=UPI002B1EF0DF|nr:BREX-2 system phosphatase PglZ [Leptothoe sp. PORK10 BA2]MEA5465552.1 BREX-2 system phosphatase PglZ [Leptothoe sp. PORK10 BA2]